MSTVLPKKSGARGAASVPRRGNLPVEVAQGLREVILRGEFVDGQPLREVELCLRFGVSRVPMREALHRLAAEGLVTQRPNHGACVARLTKEELDQIAEGCQLFEVHLLRLAVPALAAETVQRAQVCLDEADATTDPSEWARLNWRFHSTLYEPARRPLLLSEVSALRDRAERAMLMLARDVTSRVLLGAEHRAILARVRAGDGDEAARLLHAHLWHGRDEALRALAPRE